MEIAIMDLFLMLSSAVIVLSTNNRDAVFKNREDVNDVVMKTNVLRKLYASKIHCAHICYRCRRCRSYFFNSLTNICQIQSTVYDGHQEVVQEKAWQYFAMQRFGRGGASQSEPAEAAARRTGMKHQQKTEPTPTILSARVTGKTILLPSFDGSSSSRAITSKLALATQTVQTSVQVFRLPVDESSTQPSLSTNMWENHADESSKQAPLSTKIWENHEDESSKQASLSTKIWENHADESSKQASLSTKIWENHEDESSKQAPLSTKIWENHADESSKQASLSTKIWENHADESSKQASLSTKIWENHEDESSKQASPSTKKKGSEMDDGRLMTTKNSKQNVAAFSFFTTLTSRSSVDPETTVSVIDNPSNDPQTDGEISEKKNGEHFQNLHEMIVKKTAAKNDSFHVTAIPHVTETTASNFDNGKDGFGTKESKELNEESAVYDERGGELKTSLQQDKQIDPSDRQIAELNTSNESDTSNGQNEESNTPNGQYDKADTSNGHGEDFGTSSEQNEDEEELDKPEEYEAIILDSSKSTKDKNKRQEMNAHVYDVATADIDSRQDNESTSGLQNKTTQFGKRYDVISESKKQARDSQRYQLSSATPVIPGTEAKPFVTLKLNLHAGTANDQKPADWCRRHQMYRMCYASSKTYKAVSKAMSRFSSALIPLAITGIVLPTILALLYVVRRWVKVIRYRRFPRAKKDELKITLVEA